MNKIPALLFVVVAITGCNATGCGSGESLDAQYTDAGDTGDTGDTGRDTGHDGGMDIGIVDSGLPDGGDDLIDAGVNKDAGEKFSYTVYDYDAGTVENPLGPNFKFIGMTSMMGSKTNGDYWVFAPPNGPWRDPFFEKGDICWYQISKDVTKCIKIDMPNPQYYYSYGSAWPVVLENGIIAWVLYRETTSPFIIDVFTYDIINDKLTNMFSCNNCDVYGLAAGYNRVFYEQHIIADKPQYNHYSWDVINKKLDYLNIPYLMSAVYDDAYITTDSIIFAQYYYTGHFQYHFPTEAIELLFNNLDTCDLNGDILLGMGSKDLCGLASYNIKTKEFTNIDCESLVWVPNYCSDNVLSWSDGPEVANQVVIYDMETKVKRALTPKIYSYSAVCKNNKLFVSPDAGSGTVFREFFVDLEKAGFVKDGHVVPE